MLNSVQQNIKNSVIITLLHEIDKIKVVNTDIFLYLASTL